MIMRRINPPFPVMRLRTDVDRLFNEFFGDSALGHAAEWFGVRSFPAANVWEDRDNLYAEAEVPGLKLEDLEVLVEGNELTIKGERRVVTEEGVSYHRRERGAGAFRRVLRLPLEIDAEKVEAAVRDGVLTVTLPKAETARPRKVEVKNLSG